MEKFNSAVQNLQRRINKGRRPRDIFEEHGNRPHPSTHRGLLGIRVGRALRHPRTNALCGHVPGVPSGHPFA